MRKDLNYLHYLSFEKWLKMQIYVFMFAKNEFQQKV